MLILLPLVEQLLEVDAQRVGNVVKGDAAVDVLQDFQLAHGVLGLGADTHVGLTLNVVLLTIFLDEVHELLSVGLPRLAVANALNVLQLFERDGVIGSHLLKGDILEDDVWRAVELS